MHYHFKYLHFGFSSAALIDDRNKTSKIITDVVNFIIPESKQNMIGQLNK